MRNLAIAPTVLPLLNPAEVEDLGEESDIASEDEVAERDGDSETEQDCDSDTDDEDDQPTDNSFFNGKDKKTKWLKKPPSAIRIHAIFIRYG